ncbi:MAG: cell division protein FtsZ [Treponema sp.]
MNFKCVNENGIPVVMKVIGVGGGGGNAVNRMIECNIKDVEFIALNTDAQTLNIRSKAPLKIYIGEDGQGAGGNPTRGEAAANKDEEKIKEAIQGANLLFITAGMGGGTGTGAAPVVARIAKELGILTVAVVTKPFRYEGGARMRIAEEGIEKLKEQVDSYMVIENQKLMEADDDDDRSIFDDFIKVDDILRQAIQGIINVICHTGYMHVDFADIEACLKEKGRVHMATGRAEGPNAVIEAITSALSNVLLESSGIDGAKSVLINIRGAGKNLKTKQLESIEALVTRNVDSVAKIFAGIDNTDEIGEEVCVTLIATGFSDETSEKDEMIQAPSVEPSTVEAKTENSIPTRPIEVKQEELKLNGEFISGSEWGKMIKGKQPHLQGLNTRNSRTSYEQDIEDKVGDFDFRKSSLPSDSEMELPAYYRYIKR